MSMWCCVTSYQWPVCPTRRHTVNVVSMCAALVGGNELNGTDYGRGKTNRAASKARAAKQAPTRTHALKLCTRSHNPCGSAGASLLLLLLLLSFS
jgi:hypothetical protein